MIKKYNGVTLSPTAARRIFANSKDMDNRYRVDPPAPSPQYLLPSIIVCKVTEPIQAMQSGNKPGKGKGKPQTLDFPDDDATFKDANSGDDLPIFNLTEKQINIGAYVVCINLYGRLFVFVVDKCSNLL